MSTAEIADNKWELESTQPPIKGVPGIGMMALFGLFSVVFAYIAVMSLVAIVTPKTGGGLADSYKNLNAAPAAAPAEAPAAP
jgi:hypothetical protein